MTVTRRRPGNPFIKPNPWSISLFVSAIASPILPTDLLLVDHVRIVSVHHRGGWKFLLYRPHATIGSLRSSEGNATLTHDFGVYAMRVNSRPRRLTLFIATIVAPLFLSKS